jgi:transcriptional regulator with XRE-family HTH domain
MEREVLARKLGALTRQLRLERGYSQEVFGQMCKLDRTYIGMIERGEVNITVATAFKLAGGLDLSVSQFFIFLERYLDENENG